MDTLEEDLDQVVQQTQMRRVKSLIEKVKSHLEKSKQVSVFLWYLCHITAFTGWMSGLSIAGTTLRSNNNEGYTNVILGVAASIYPLLKYADLEGLRNKYNNLALFCADLLDKLEDSKDGLTRILQDGYDEETEAVKFNKMVDFVMSTKKILDKMEIGSVDLQSSLVDFERVINSNQTTIQRKLRNFGATKS